MSAAPLLSEAKQQYFKTLQSVCTVFAILEQSLLHIRVHAHQQARRGAQVQSVLKPVGPQQLSKVTFRPCLLADQSHTLLSDANLPVGSSSYAASNDVRIRRHLSSKGTYCATVTVASIRCRHAVQAAYSLAATVP